MGVTGLWRLIEPAGKPVPIETLENKVLAVDISIWLHQMVKGYQDAKGAPMPNAHLIGLFQRLCKLLYFRIKPVFVFDGGFPELKKETIFKRQENKMKYNSESERIRRELTVLLSKKTAISSLLGKQISPKKSKSVPDPTNSDDMFKLPALPEREESESESEDEDTSSSSLADLHSVDLESNKFKNLPVKDKYDLLVELKETRKMNSWGRIHELPKKSDNFSDFQMQRLLKRRKIQECLQETEKEMGDGSMSLNELESLLNEDGIDTKIESLPTRRIASNNNTRFLLINNVKQVLAEAKKKEEAEKTNVAESSDNKNDSKNDELEKDLEQAIKMSLDTSNLDTSAYTSKTDDSWTSIMSDSEYSYSDSEEEDGFEQPEMSSAKAYIMQYSDFTHKAITKLVSNKGDKPKQPIAPDVNKIINELNHEKSIIVDNVEITSSDDESSKQKTDDRNNSSISINSDDNIGLNICETAKRTCIPKQEDLNEEFDDELQRAIQMSLECVTDDITVTKAISPVCDDVQSQGIDETQSSVICVEQPIQNITILDTSTEENDVRDITEVTNINIKQESDSEDDDEFEEVTESGNVSIKPVVELTLNMDEMSDEDIFADVFAPKKEEFKVGEICKDRIESVTKENVESDLNVKIINNIHDSVKIPRTDILVSQTDRITVSESVNIPKSITNMSIQKNNIENTIITEKLVVNVENTLKDKEITIIPIEKHAPIPDIPETAIPKDYIVSSPAPQVITEQLNTMNNEIHNEEQDLLREKIRLDRIGRNITEQMTKEAQELLQLFGIPYIVAPMEAEAQCAFLENVKLTDGTITDDSDIWLFGGKTVYKNFFNQKKHVLQFLSERIERSFNLSREQLVLLALLVGSDYTMGVTGVGPVTALEILASFPFNKKLLNEAEKQARYTQMITGLQEFKQWVRAGKRTDNVSLKKKLRNVTLNEDFPSVRVVQAYLEPNVEKSEDKFTWGDMDITLLRDYTKKQFGWSQNKLDEIIKPVIKRLQDRKNQKTVHDYFKRKIDFQSLEDQMSKRVKAAVQKMGPETSSSFTEPAVPKTKKRTVKKKDDTSTAGPSRSKKAKATEESVLKDMNVKIVPQAEPTSSDIGIAIRKTDRYQEIIPQREKDKQSLLQNRLKAIETFRKANIDKKRKFTKRKPNLPKEKADLSESSDSD